MMLTISLLLPLSLQWKFQLPLPGAHLVDCANSRGSIPSELTPQTKSHSTIGFRCLQIVKSFGEFITNWVSFVNLLFELKALMISSIFCLMELRLVPFISRYREIESMELRNTAARPMIIPMSMTERPWLVLRMERPNVV